jgi:phosphatidylglycerophosphate synthase
MARRVSLDEIRTRTYKRRDAWWTVWLVDPLASRLVWLVAPWRWVTPNRLTTLAFVVGIGSAVAFWQGTYGWLLVGALLFHLSFVLDCMDGKIARLNGTGSVFGAWLDYVFDRLRVAACVVGLFGGQFVLTDNFVYIWLGGVVVFLDMFRYLNALQMGKVKTEMKTNLATARGPEATVSFVEDTAIEHPVGTAALSGDPADDAAGEDDDLVDVYSDFRTRFGLFVRIRNVLVRQRIRAHVISGIEFMMFVFIVGPVVGWIVGMTVLSAVLLGGFELLLIYKLWTATKTYERKIATTVQIPAQASGEVSAVRV